MRQLDFAGAYSDESDDEGIPVNARFTSSSPSLAPVRAVSCLEQRGTQFTLTPFSQRGSDAAHTKIRRGRLHRETGRGTVFSSFSALPFVLLFRTVTL